MTSGQEWVSLIDQLGAASMEAREVITELRSELKEARRVQREFHQEVERALAVAVDERIAAEVAKGLDAYGETLRKAMSDAVDKVGREFDKLAKIYIEGRKGEPTLPDLAKRRRGEPS